MSLEEVLVRLETESSSLVWKSEVVQDFRLKKNKCDHSIFYRQSAVRNTLLVVYVNDIVLRGSDFEEYPLKSFLHTKFHTKDLGQLKYFLGVEVSRSRKGIFICQRKYILDLLVDTGKLTAKLCSTIIVPNIHLIKDDVDPFDDLERYIRLVGKLNYLTVTRPDIAFAVSVVSQFMSAPTVKHWEALE